MFYDTFPKFASFFNRHGCAFLVFSWILGLYLGVISATHSNIQGSAWRLELLNSDTSLFAFFIICFLLPLWLSFWAIRFRAFVVICFLAIIKSFLYGYIHAFVYNAFGDAGWLMKSLLLFSDTYLTVLLLWYWIKNITNHGQLCDVSTAKFLITGFCVCVLDVAFIVPFIKLLVV